MKPIGKVLGSIIEGMNTNLTKGDIMETKSITIQGPVTGEMYTAKCNPLTKEWLVYLPQSKGNRLHEMATSEQEARQLVKRIDTYLEGI